MCVFVCVTKIMTQNIRHDTKAIWMVVAAASTNSWRKKREQKDAIKQNNNSNNKKAQQIFYLQNVCTNSNCSIAIIIAILNVFMRNSLIHTNDGNGFNVT